MLCLISHALLDARVTERFSISLTHLTLILCRGLSEHGRENESFVKTTLHVGTRLFEKQGWINDSRGGGD